MQYFVNFILSMSQNGSLQKPLSFQFSHCSLFQSLLMSTSLG